MAIQYTTNLKGGEYFFPIVIYSESDKDTEYPVTLSDDDIRSILDFCLDMGEDISLIWAFRDYNPTLYDSLTDNIESFLVKNKKIGEFDEYGIAFPVEIAKEADRIRLEY